MLSKYASVTSRTPASKQSKTNVKSLDILAESGAESREWLGNTLCEFEVPYAPLEEQSNRSISPAHSIALKLVADIVIGQIIDWHSRLLLEVLHRFGFSMVCPVYPARKVWCRFSVCSLCTILLRYAERRPKDQQPVVYLCIPYELSIFIKCLSAYFISEPRI